MNPDPNPTWPADSPRDTGPTGTVPEADTGKVVRVTSNTVELPVPERPPAPVQETRVATLPPPRMDLGRFAAAIPPAPPEPPPSVELVKVHEVMAPIRPLRVPEPIPDPTRLTHQEKGVLRARSITHRPEGGGVGANRGMVRPFTLIDDRGNSDFVQVPPYKTGAFGAANTARMLLCCAYVTVGGGVSQFNPFFPVLGFSQIFNRGDGSSEIHLSEFATDGAIFPTITPLDYGASVGNILDYHVDVPGGAFFTVTTFVNGVESPVNFILQAYVMTNPG